jgi:hypothetical protein
VLCKQIWDELSGDQHLQDGFVRRRVSTSSGLNLFLAVSIPSLMPSVILEVTKGALPLEFRPFVCAGFSLEAVSQRSGEAESIRVILSLTAGEFVEVFGSLADDLVSSLTREKNLAASVSYFYERVLQWRGLFQAGRLVGLTENEQQGLWGELWILQNLMCPAIGLKNALESWKGPGGGIHDFEVRQLSVEVKTSSRHQDVITVSGAHQLANSADIRLAICGLMLEVFPSAGTSLAELIETIRTSIMETSPSSLAQFNALLIEAGYIDSTSSRYRTAGYIIRKLAFWEVRDGFPRIDMAHIPPAVVDVKYSILWSGCREFEVDKLVLLEMLRGSHQ